MTEQTTLRFDAGVCDGHFPGRPIVPGFVLLARAWASYAEAGRVAVGVRHARFRQAVAPGESLAMVVRANKDREAVRIDLRRGDASVAEATFVTGTLSEAPLLERAAEHQAHARHELTPAELDALLPHRPPIRMVRAVEHDDDQGIACIAAVSSACSIVSERRVTVLATVEAAAQAAALWASLRAGHDNGSGTPRMGYLVGVRDLAWTTSTIPTERRFRVSAQLVAMAEPLTHYTIDASLDGTPLMQGTIATVLAG